MSEANTEERLLLDPQEWKERAGKSDDFSDDAGMVKWGASPEVKQEGEEDRKLRFVISDGKLDRDGDKLDVNGWKTKEFEASGGPVLFAHNYRQPVVARASQIKVENEQLRATAEFPPPETYEFGDTLYQLYAGGWMKATSVGFKPVKWSFVEEDDRPFGIDFEEMELLEFSLVPVPANPRALVDASKSFDLTPLKEWCEATLDHWYEKDSHTGVWIPREKLEEVYAMLSPSQHPVAHSGEQVLSITYDHDQARIRDALGNFNKEKGAISYSGAHRNGTPKDDEGAEWDGPKEVAAADVSDLKVMCCWVDSDNSENKGAYKLPHHRASGSHAVVWRGVSAAGNVVMGARGGPNIPDGDIPGVKRHLARHYREFDKVPPWEQEEGRTYELLNSLEAEGKATVDLLEYRNSLERRLFPDLFEEEMGEGDGGGGEELDLSDPEVTEAIGEAVREEVRRLTGQV